MAVTLTEINKLRQATQAGLMDCKKALTEANGDMEAAIAILRKKGQAVAAKRSDREAAEGCVLSRVDGNYAMIVALKCETDFVAKNADFVALANQIADAAVAAKAKSLEEVLALTVNGMSVADAVTERSGVTGEKMELDGFNYVEGEHVVAYNHMNGNFLCTKAGINPAHVDSEEHMESNMGKGWITAEDVAKAKEIKKTVAEEKAASLNEDMIKKIAEGMVNKYYKENCLLNQAFIDDAKISVADYLKKSDKDLTVVDFKRFTLRAE